MADNTTLNVGSGGDVIATDDIAGVKVQRVKVQYGADGSATDVAAGAGLPVTGDYLEVTGSVSSATSLIASTDCRAYSWVSVHVTAAGVGTVTFQASNDNSNWVSVLLVSPTSTGNTPSSSVSSSTGLFHGPICARYFRAQVTSYTSGTFTATAEFSAAGQGWTVTPVHVGNTPISVYLGAAVASGYGVASASDTSIALDSSSARTASGNGAAWARYAKGGAFLVAVTAVSGTAPTLTVRVQTSYDGATYADLDTTNAQTATINATGQYILRVYPGLTDTANTTCNNILSYYTRLAWTIGGTTPSFTFSTRAWPVGT